MIQLAEDLELPLDVVTQKVAILARTGAGKTYTAKRLAEQMLGAGAQVIILDPVGVWYGLRLGADGQPDGGLPIPVLGGDHGDLEIEDDAGERVAEVLVARRSPAVLDLSLMTRAGQRRFATGFARTFYNLKRRQRSAVHLVVEEAQLFAPQRFSEGDAAMVGAFELLVRLGRNFGIGTTLVSQRPQSVNKEVLSQAELLILMQIAGAHERRALDDWINAHGVRQRAEVIADLTELGIGEAFVWSPSWLRILQRVKVLPIATYDASATPIVGEHQDAPGDLPALDLAGLADELAEPAERPRGRRRQSAPPAVPPLDEDALEAKVLELVRRELRAYTLPLSAAVAELERVQRGIGRLCLDVDPVKRTDPPPPAAPPAMDDDIWQPATPAEAVDWATRDALADRGIELKAGARRMLAVLGTLHPIPVTRQQVGLVARLSASSGTFSGYLSTLRTSGLIRDLPDGRIELTDEGAAVAGSTGDPPEGEALINLYRPSLKAGACRMLDALLERRGRWTSRTHLATITGLTKSSGTFSGYLSNLRTLGLIEDGTSSDVRINESLWWRGSQS